MKRNKSQIGTKELSARQAFEPTEWESLAGVQGDPAITDAMQDCLSWLDESIIRDAAKGFPNAAARLYSLLTLMIAFEDEVVFRHAAAVGKPNVKRWLIVDGSTWQRLAARDVNNMEHLIEWGFLAIHNGLGVVHPTLKARQLVENDRARRRSERLTKAA